MKDGWQKDGWQGIGSKLDVQSGGGTGPDILPLATRHRITISLVTLCGDGYDRARVGGMRTADSRR